MSENISPLERFEKALRDAGSRFDTRTSGRDRRWTCPAHEDTHPSLDVREGDDGQVLFKCRAGCTQEEVLSALEFEARDLFPTNSAHPGAQPESQRRKSTGLGVQRGGNRGDPPKIGGLTPAQYAEAKCLDAEFLKSLGLREVRYFGGAPALEIPYYDVNGDLEATRYRLRLEKGPEGDERFRWKKGSKPILYGLWKLNRAREAGYVLLVEGESDCHTLWSHGVPALGIPGSGTWRNEWSGHLDGLKTVYFLCEPDAGGEKLAEALSAAPFADRLQFVRLTGAKDPSELHHQMCDEGGFTDALDAALEAAVPVGDVLRQARNERTEEAWKICCDLAAEPRILDRFAADLRLSGVVGEERPTELIFLAVVSRLLDRPVSVAVKGPSAAGKNYIVERTLEFFSPSAFYSLSAMSERALVYSEEPLQHRMLVIYEAAGMQGDFASYLLRSLLSEGRVRYETVERTKDGLRPRLIEREGPTGLIVTTTLVSLHPENETRLLSLQVDDTPEQTGRILSALAAGAEGGGEQRSPDFAPWHALSDWLEGGECRVVVPFASQLVQEVLSVAVRQRRDFGQLFTLIKAHALLHQKSRGRDGAGCVVATVEDYAIVYELVADLVGEAAGTEVSGTVRETVEAVAELLKEKPAVGDGPVAVSAMEVSKQLGLDKSATSRRIRAAIRAGYLENLDGRKGRPLRLVLGEPLPEQCELLPPPQRLEKRNDEEVPF